MNTSNAVRRLAALAHATRLSLFRLLVQKGPEGLCVGDISAKLGVAQPTISFHLKELAHAGLIKSRQEGRFVYYAADFKTMNSLLSYLTENCCGGRDCAPACAPTQEKAA